MNRTVREALPGNRGYTLRSSGSSSKPHAGSPAPPSPSIALVRVMRITRSRLLTFRRAETHLHCVRESSVVERGSLVSSDEGREVSCLAALGVYLSVRTPCTGRTTTGRDPSTRRRLLLRWLSLLLLAFLATYSAEQVKRNRRGVFFGVIRYARSITFPAATIIQYEVSTSQPAHTLWKYLIVAKNTP